MLETRQAIEQQQFETAFFELLKLTRDVVQLFEYTYLVQAAATDTTADSPSRWREQTKHGYAALNAIAAVEFKNDDSEVKGPARVQALVDKYKVRVYHQYPAALGPYFRLLYQTFKLVAEAPIDDKKKLQFANIARGQLSEGAVLLLALNGLTWRGRAFVEFIESFGLIEHMHPSYRARFREDLLHAYSRRAFLGSKERKQQVNDADPDPGPFAFDRDPDQPDFVMSHPFNDEAAANRP